MGIFLKPFGISGFFARKIFSLLREWKVKWIFDEDELVKKQFIPYHTPGTFYMSGLGDIRV